MDYSALENCPLFRGVAKDELTEILNRTPHTVREYEKGETILYAMKEADRLGIILDGFAEVQKTFPNGNQVNVSIRRRGDMIGSAAVFSSGGRYPCDVVAIEPVRLLVLNKRDLIYMMQKSAVLLENFMTAMGSTTYMLQQRLEMMSYSGIAQKAAYYLLVKTRQSGKKMVTIPESVSKWALMMNVSRTSLHRELRRLEREGMIGYRPPMIEIIDREALLSVLGSS